jgi:hypothetical protein
VDISTAGETGKNEKPRRWPGLHLSKAKSNGEVYAWFSATTVRDAPTTHGDPTTRGRASLHQPE